MWSFSAALSSTLTYHTVNTPKPLPLLYGLPTTVTHSLHNLDFQIFNKILQFIQDVSNCRGLMQITEYLLVKILQNMSQNIQTLMCQIRRRTLHIPKFGHVSCRSNAKCLPKKYQDVQEVALCNMQYAFLPVLTHNTLHNRYMSKSGKEAI